MNSKNDAQQSNTTALNEITPTQEIIDHPIIIRMRFIGDEDYGMPWASKTVGNIQPKISNIDVPRLKSMVHEVQNIVLSMGSFEHPQINEILDALHEVGCLVSMRVAQSTVENNSRQLMEWLRSGMLHTIDVVATQPDAPLMKLLEELYPQRVTLSMVVGCVTPSMFRHGFAWQGDIMLLGLPSRLSGRIHAYINERDVVPRIQWCREHLVELCDDMTRVSMDAEAMRVFGVDDGSDGETIHALNDDAMMGSIYVNYVDGVCALGDYNGDIRCGFDATVNTIDGVFEKLQAASQQIS